MAATPSEQLERIRGLGPARAARLVASFELGLRMVRSNPAPKRRMSSPEEVFDLLGPGLVFEQREIFRVLSLGPRNDLLSVDTVARGTRDACMVHARDIFSRALSIGASSIILVHNHPSGDPAPSIEDRELTKRVARGGALLGIEVMDHIIIASQGYISLREEGCLS